MPIRNQIWTRTGWGSAALAGLVLASSCGGDATSEPQGPDVIPTVVIDSPQNGSFSTAPSTAVSGRVMPASADNLELVVNGAVVEIVDGAWSTDVTLDADAIFNPILAEVSVVNADRTARDRVVVVAGESVPDGDVIDDGVALRINDVGLRNVGPVVATEVDLDLATLLPVGTVVSDGVTVATPAPALSDFYIELDASVDSATGIVTLLDLQANFQVARSGIDCGLRVRANATHIAANFTFEPDANRPAYVDVDQTSDVAVTFENFHSDFVSGICDAPIIEQIIGLIVGDIEAQLVEGFEGFLNDPDGSGPMDSPIAVAISDALAGIQLAGSAGAALGLDVDAPMLRIDEDSDGMLIVAAIGFTAPEVVEGAPDLPATYAATSALPQLGVLSPGGEPYGLAFSVSTAAFNQLLAGEIEGGLLRASVTDIGGLPLTAGFLGLLIEEFKDLEPDAPIRLELTPTIAPVLTGNAGSSGELAELAIAQLGVEFVDATTDARMLGIVVDVRVGLDIVFDDAAGAIQFSIGSAAPGTVAAVLLDNPLGAQPADVETVLIDLLPTFLPELADSLESFPIPSLLGLKLTSIETARQEQFLTFFLDISPNRPAYAKTVLAQGPTAYWRMNDRSTTRARAEVTWPTSDAVISAGVAALQSGAPGLRPAAGFAGFEDTNTWFAFNGSDSSVVSELPELTAAAGSVSFWVLDGGGGVEVLYYGSSGGGDGLGGNQELHVNWGSDGALELFIADSTGAGDAHIATAGRYSDGRWHHVAATWDATGTALYVDGGALTGGEVVTGAGSPGDYAFTGRHRFGKPAASTREFAGLADELAVWNRALTPAEVEAQYNAAGIVPPQLPAYPQAVLDQSPLQYWRFNDSGAIGAPELQPGDNVRFQGGVSSNQSGFPALRATAGYPGFDAINTWVSFDGGDGAVIDGLPAGAMTATVGSVSFWVKTAAQATQVLYYGAAESGGDGYGDNHELHVNVAANGQLQLFIEGTGSAADVNIATAGIYADDQWHHVVATWDGAETALHVDGGITAGGETITGSGSGATFAFTSRHRFGKPAASTRELDGEVDELAIWDRALSAAEAARQFEAATAPGP